MKKSVLCFISFALLFASSLLTKASNPPAAKWLVKNPFEQKVFIKNKGQYNLPGKAPSNDILFGAHLDGLDYFFTANGIWIEHYIPVKRTDEELEQLQLPTTEKNNTAFEYKYVPEFHQINFINADPSVEITGDNAVKQYYNFRINGTTNIKASAFKKISYRNIYPCIDMEFYFSEDKKGFEYSFIVHPGADISQIKMQYPLSNEITLTGEGTIKIVSSFGTFTDHAPVANQEDNYNLSSNSVYSFPSKKQFIYALGHLNIPNDRTSTTLPKQVACSFTLQNGIVQFKTGEYDKTQDLIIDPWTETPPFQGGFQSGRAYDLDWDNAGNCYIYGGSEHYAYFPFLLLKYDSTGTLLWSTETDDYLYGGFAVDRNSQSVYVAEGAYIITSPKILKLNQAGEIFDSSAGSINLEAMFRIVFSSQYNELVVAGGSYPNSPAATAMYIDTGLTTGTLVYVLNPPDPYHYMWGLTLDNSGNCYMATSTYWADTSLFNNQMFKLPMPTLSPTTWEVRDGYQVIVYQPQYINPHNNGEGLNGMTVSDTTLYTYDSYTLKKWGTTHGTLLQTLNINGDSTLPSYWGGIASDSCGNVFLGSHDTIKLYNSDLTLLNTFKEPDTIYDVKLGLNNILYACGAQFITAIQLTPHLVNTNTNTDADTTLYYKICLGNSATLQAAGAISYTWSPSYGLSATTGDSVIATPSVTTTYSVICSGSLTCPPNAKNDTFKIVVTVNTLPLPEIKTTPTSSTICLGKTVELKASGVTTYQWTPSQGLNYSSGSSVIAFPTISTTYTVKGIDSNGCYAIGQSIVTVDTLPQVAVSQTASYICAGQPDTLSAIGQPAYQWSPATGLNSTTGDTVIASPILTTTYTVAVTGNDGCTNAAQIEVDVLTPNVIISPALTSICPGHGILLTASGASRYQWSPSTGLDSIAPDTVIASPTTSTTYTIIGNNRFGCPDTVQTAVTVSFPNVIITPSSPSIFCGQSISLYASGADTFQWNPSTGLNNNTGDTIIANPTVTTTYIIIGGNGCYDTATTVITVDLLPVVASPAVICDGSSTTLIASGATFYTWTPSTGLSATTGDNLIANPTTTTTYIITGSNSIGCMDTTTDIVTVISTPNKPTFMQDGDTLISSAQHDNQWYRNDSLLMGDTSQDLVITILGEYQVRINNEANGCSTLSDSVKIDSLTGINQLSVLSDRLSVYPNPFNTAIYVTINSSAQNVKDWNLQVTDVLGRIIYTRVSLNYSNEIDLSKTPSGVYFIIVTNENGRAVFPVIRQE